MKSFRRYGLLPAVTLAALFLLLAPAHSAQNLPDRVRDAEFWQVFTDFSESGGFFQSDNYVSNERSYQDVCSALSETHRPASAYIGVGPEQNFTYIAALRPQIAFVVDIRRQNAIEQLMYKALFELSADRAEFLSRLFGRPRPDSLSPESTAEELLNAYTTQAVIASLSVSNTNAIINNLTETHGFDLDESDLSSLRKIHRAFRVGPGLAYNGTSRLSNPLPNPLPTFAELMQLPDGGVTNCSFLANETNYQAIRNFELKNLLIPIVGDFAGPKALKAVGRYLQNHDASVTAFYASNVEQYLFMDGVAQPFYANLADLPTTPQSVLVRALVRTKDGIFSPSPGLASTSHIETRLFSISELTATFKAGLIHSYDDIVR